MMTNLLHGAHVANKLFSTIARLRLLLVMFLTLTVTTNAWGETKSITLTQSALGLTGSYTTNTEKTIDGVTFKYSNLMKNNDNIQAQASGGEIYNSTAIPGNIVSIAVTHSGTARSSTIYFGTSAKATTEESSTFSGTKTIEPTSDYQYFYIKRGSNAAYWTQIVITYETSSMGGDSGGTGDNEEGDETCDRWVEVDVSSIESTDAVMITMHHGTAPNETIYALNSSKGTSSAPPATEITPTQLATKNWSSDNLLWNIETDTNGKLILHPNGTSNNLYCNTSNSNDRIRIGNSQNALTNHQFTIEKDYLKFSNATKTYYIGVYVGGPDWRGYTSTSSNISGQTLKFYKYVECTAEPTVFVIPKCGGDGGGTWLVVIEWFATF